jgi:hypothetical protein
MSQGQADLRARVLEEVKRAPSPTRAAHRRRVAMVATAGAVATTALFFAMGGFAPATRPVEYVAFTAGLALFAAAVMTRLSGGASGTSSRSMLGRPSSVLVTACVVTAPALALAALVAALCWPRAAAEPFPASANFTCAAMTLAQGALPLIALLLPRRGTDPLHPAITGAALGMTAGAWTAMMAYLRCPHAAAFHCILAHVGPTLVLTAIGALLGAALLRIKA